MITSVCTLGYTEDIEYFVGQFKRLPYYKKRDSDTEGVRIHVSYVDDPNLLGQSFVHRYATPDDNFANVLNDGTQETNKESTIGNDKPWLIESNGHDTIVEAVEDHEKYLEVLLALISKGYRTYITSSYYVDVHWEEIQNAAKANGAEVTYHDSMDAVLADIDAKYLEKVSRHRANLLSASYDAEPCGLSN